MLGLLACVPASGFVPAPAARFAGTGATAGLTRAQQRSATASRPLRMTAGGDGDSTKSPWEAFTTDMAKKLAVAATVAAVTFSAPGDALAARSGGRMGGRSFSSPSVSPSASRIWGERGALALHSKPRKHFFCNRSAAQHVLTEKVAVEALRGDESRRLFLAAS